MPIPIMGFDPIQNNLNQGGSLQALKIRHKKTAPARTVFFEKV